MSSPRPRSNNPLLRRPTETVTGVGLFVTLYAALAEAGVPNTAALVLALVVAFVPVLVSGVVDALQK